MIIIDEKEIRCIAEQRGQRDVSAYEIKAEIALDIVNSSHWYPFFRIAVYTAAIFRAKLRRWLCHP